MDLFVRRRELLIGGKPYDAEIEFLQSSGTQYIDTGVNPLPTDEMIIKFGGHSGSGSGKAIFGCRGSVGVIAAVRATSSSITYLGVCFTGAAPSYASANYYTLNFTNGVVKVYNDIGNEVPPSYQQTLSNDTNYPTLTLFYRNGMSGSYAASGRIYYCKIARNGAVILELTPVRVGTTGYMYDKVSGQLFGNAGTGDFILGNDI